LRTPSAASVVVRMADGWQSSSRRAAGDVAAFGSKLAGTETRPEYTTPKNDDHVLEVCGPQESQRGRRARGPAATGRRWHGYGCLKPEPVQSTLNAIALGGRSPRTVGELLFFSPAVTVAILAMDGHTAACREPSKPSLGNRVVERLSLSVKATRDGAGFPWVVAAAQEATARTQPRRSTEDRGLIPVVRRFAQVASRSVFIMLRDRLSPAKSVR